MRKKDKQNMKLTIEVSREEYDLLKQIRDRVYKNQEALWLVGAGAKPKMLRLGDVLKSMLNRKY